jgi:hypothetical protein
MLNLTGSIYKNIMENFICRPASSASTSGDSEQNDSNGPVFLFIHKIGNLMNEVLQAHILFRLRKQAQLLSLSYCLKNQMT